MKYYLFYKNNKIIGYSNCLNISEEFECREANKEEFENYICNYKEKQENEKKLSELINWFDNYFDKQLNQSLWQDDFTVSHDDYFNKDYASIDEVKAQAKVVRDEIRELRVNKFNTSLSKQNNDGNNKIIQNDSVI